MNSITVAGNVGIIEELKTIGNNTKVFSFSVADNIRIANGVNETAWYNCKTFNKLAEICAKFIHKGDKITVVGSLHPRIWESNGKHGLSLELTVNSIEFGEKKDSEAQNNTVSNTEYKPVDNTTEIGPIGKNEDDLPF